LLHQLRERREQKLALALLAADEVLDAIRGDDVDRLITIELIVRTMSRSLDFALCLEVRRRWPNGRASVDVSMMTSELDRRSFSSISSLATSSERTS